MSTTGDGNPVSETDLKAAFWNTSTVDARLGAAFPGPERRDASLLLAQLVGEVPSGTEWDSDEATCRLMLAALKVSGGDVRRLALWVEAARLDPRDLIAAAEYRRELGSESLQNREADLAEYLDWVSGGTFFSAE